MAKHEIIIIGAGAAGLTAGLYAARAGMKVVLLEKAAPGGQMLLTEIIENFPGFPEGIEGHKLAENFKSQALKAGLEIVTQEVKEISSAPAANALSKYNVKTEDNSYTTASIILACGAYPRRLGLPKEEELTGRGVSYCATCDGPLFREKQVIVVGAGNAAVEEALYLSKFVRKITLVHRRDRLRADKVLRDRASLNPKIDFLWNCRIVEILGEEKLNGVILEDVRDGKKSRLRAEGLFIFVGFKPNTDFIKGLVKLDGKGFIVTDQNLETSQRGIFACGDCRAKLLRQVVTACGEGAQTAQAARNYVEELKGTSYD